jgi:hypothetical protein
MGSPKPAHFDHLGLPLIDNCQSVENLVDLQHIRGAAGRNG